jgi:hypothetical protein
MTLERVLQLYSEGAITELSLASEVVARLDPSNVDAVLSSVPPEAIEELADYVTSFDPDALRVSFGGAEGATPAQFEIARRWLDRRTGAPASRGVTE